MHIVVLALVRSFIVGVSLASEDIRPVHRRHFSGAFLVGFKLFFVGGHAFVPIVGGAAASLFAFDELATVLSLVLPDAHGHSTRNLDIGRIRRDPQQRIA